MTHFAGLDDGTKDLLSMITVHQEEIGKLKIGQALKATNIICRNRTDRAKEVKQKIKRKRKHEIRMERERK